MTTLKREVRLIINQTLEEHGINTEAIPPYPSIVDVLTNRVLSIPAFAQATLKDKYKNMPQVGKDAVEMARKRLMLSERITAELGIMPDLNKRMWTTVLNKIVEAEEDGESFNNYVKWYKAGNDYNRPKTFQIVKNPALLWGTWKEAQLFSETQKPVVDEDGGMYV